ncbi:hypothetical protein LIER_22938 [Lithospermum erythrorhizon]|uniref:Mitochondrial pyruvate carrier n=1 Tax=Lithospermum erythrorhizon TaxID=34254 RepID=A0AAV3QWX8_LITER
MDWIVHFWAPTFKWGISIANIADFAKPPEKLSYPQQIDTGSYPLKHELSNPLLIDLQLLSTFPYVNFLHSMIIKFNCAAVTCTGVIWSRYSMVITPKNWNLFSVNIAMAGTGIYQLSRKIKNDYFNEEAAAAAAEE